MEILFDRYADAIARLDLDAIAAPAGIPERFLLAHEGRYRGYYIPFESVNRAERGAVDPEVALQMAAGVRDRLGADWGISTTGVAGPDPQDGQAVGTVYVAVAGPVATGARAGKVVSLRLNGDRADIRRESVRSVLELLHEELSGNARAQDTEHNGGN